MYPRLSLKTERAATIVSRHPWLFSGAFTGIPADLPGGSPVHIVDADDAVIATGTFSRHSQIAVRIFAFAEIIIDENWLRERIELADARRRLVGLGNDTGTAGYRVVFGESDGLPGLIVDRYADVVVFQLTTAGTEQLRDSIISVLDDLFHPRSLYERSDQPVRREEGLEVRSGVAGGEAPGLVEFTENGRRCLADVAEGQKTGFYLDQRDLRQEIYRLAAGRRTLDMFSYTGAAGLAALAGGATSAHFVDASGAALDLCRKQAELNGFDANCISSDDGDVFQWLSARSEPEYDMVLVDPPALIKSRRHGDAGRKAYHFLNRAAMRLVCDNGLFVTSSCSAFFIEEDFAVMLRRASEQAEVNLSLIRTVRQSPDHPLSLYFPEASYLKSFICSVSR